MSLPFNGYSRLTSGFRLPERPDHPAYDLVSYAPGQAPPTNSVVRALKEGVIGQSTMVPKGNDPTWEWGNYVRLDTDDGQHYIFYCHLAQRLVSAGQRVKKGDPIGIEGNTGYSFGQHVHVEVRRYGTTTVVDPREVMGEMPNVVGSVVHYGAVSVTGVKLNKTSEYLSIDNKKTLQLKATVSPSNAANKAVTWKTSDSKIAKVNSSGLVTPVAPGTATITCTTKDGGKTAKCKVRPYSLFQSKGKGFWEVNIPFYSSSTAKEPQGTFSGPLYLKSTTKKNGRYLLCTDKSQINKSGVTEKFFDADQILGRRVISEGKSYTLYNPAALYPSSGAKTKSRSIKGKIYIQNGHIINGRAPVTDNKAHCGKGPVSKYAIGWMNVSTLRKYGF